MKKQYVTRDQQQVLDAMSGFTEPTKIKQIKQGLSLPLSERTLQRRLLELQNLELVVAEGSTSARRYRLSRLTGLSLSKTADAIAEAVNRPMHMRQPVAYNQEFLQGYIPNQTYYLSESVRKHLHTIGPQTDLVLEPATYAKRILHRLLIDLSWNSSRLEGNTYSLLDTERLLEFGAIAAGTNHLEAQMILNHKAAIEFMVEHALSQDLTQSIVFNIHALLADNLLANPKACGQLRRIPVGIGKTVYQPLEIPQVLAENFEMIINKANQIKDPFEQSFFLFVQLPYLQGFEDVNKRVSRLSCNIPLLKNNMAPLSFIDMPTREYINGLLGIYELNKPQLMAELYVWAYERSAKQYPFVQYTLQKPNLLAMKYRKELKEIVAYIVKNKLTKNSLIETIADWSEQHIEQQDVDAFCHLAETQLASLHAGNIAIYKLTEMELAAWHNAV